MVNAVVFTWPPRTADFLHALPGYFPPWNLMFFALGAVLWVYLTPVKATLQTFGWHWVGDILLRNSALVFVL